MSETPHDRVLRQYEQGERAALEALLRRVGETEARMSVEAADAPGRLRARLDELLGRLADAKKETERRAESFREELLAGDPSPDAFRARLVMLEMEHASRVRLAEEGLRILGAEVESALAAARSRVKSLCDEVREGLTFKVQPERLRLVEALAEASRRAGTAERALESLGAQGGRAAAEAAETAERAQREAAALKAQAEEDRRSRAQLEDALRSARLEAQRIEALALQKAEEAAAEASAEREELRRRWRAAEHEAEQARAAADAARDAAARRPRPEADDGRLSEVASQRDRALEAALALRREFEKRAGALEEARVRVAAAEGEAAAARAQADESARELKRLRAEHSSLVERLAGADAEASAARKALEDARRQAREAEESARVYAGRLRDLEEDRRRAPGPGPAAPAAGPEAGDWRAKAEALRQELDAQRAEVRAWQRRLLEADAARDRALAETRSGWAAEQERYEESLAEKARETMVLRSQLETSERAWQETLARQDGSRMQEIFKLRAEVQKLQWRLRDLEGGKPPEPGA